MSDSEDDMPITELIKKRTRDGNPKNSSAKKIAVSVKREKPAPTKTSSGSNGSKSEPSRSSSGNKSADYYENTKKGFLVEKLLCRWWYALEWPKADDIAQPPSGYEALDGFVGVFISTRTDSLGHIMDLRDMESKPCLRNVSRYTAEEVKRLCILAYERQMEALAENEGTDNKLYRALASELRDIRRVAIESAEKEAKKYNFS